MFRLKLVPDNTKIAFVSVRHIAIGISLAIVIAAVVVVYMKGFNFGIDFKGGTVIEIETQQPADLTNLRTRLNALDIGEVQLQRFGDDRDVLIRVGAPKNDVSSNAGEKVVQRVQAELGNEVTYRRIESVGPQVSAELIRAATIAVLVSVMAMFAYIWFRFEWQFGLGAIIATVHDVMATILVFSIFQLEFDLTTIAALLTIVGYSMNDTVVVYDRMRENLRKYKKMELGELIDLSLNETLSRTLMTSVTTLLALFALFIFGGEVIRSFTFAMIFGIFIGTYSSVYVAAPVLMAIGITREWGNGQLTRAKSNSGT